MTVCRRLNGPDVLGNLAMWFVSLGLGCLPVWAQDRVADLPGCATDEFAAWTLFTTANGTLGGEGFPVCQAFDTNGDGTPTSSLTLKVGQRNFVGRGSTSAGGGLVLHARWPTGRVTVSVDGAVAYASPTDRRNLAGGLFELLLDGTVLDSLDVGPIPTGEVKRFMLHGEAAIRAGHHEVRIRVRRPFRSTARDHAPRQYLDHLRMVFSPS